MADSSTPAVIAGLAVGIALIMLFGSIFTPERPRREEINNFNLYRTLVDATTFTIPYSFSDIRQDRIVNMTIDPDGMILLNVIVPQGSTLEIHPLNELLSKLEASNPNLIMHDLVVFVDEVQQDVVWVYANDGTITSIELESGDHRIDIAGSLILG